MHEEVSAKARSCDRTPSRSPADRPTLSVWISPRHTHAAFAREQLRLFLTENGIGADDLAPFMIAAGEALANALEHARAGEPIEITAVVGDGAMYATIADTGRGVAAPPMDLYLPPPQAERGRGFPLMQRCTDLFAVRSHSGIGTAVILGRHFHDAERAVPEIGQLPYGVMLVDGAGTVLEYDPYPNAEVPQHAVFGANVFADFLGWANIDAFARTFDAWIARRDQRLVPFEFVNVARGTRVTVLVARLSIDDDRATICLAASPAAGGT